MTWRPVPIPQVHDAWATPYGFMIDHIWAADGNAARRPHWPDGMHIAVRPCEDLDEPGPWNDGAMTCWVFFDDDTEYGAPDEDLKATDWLVGEAA